MFNKIDEAQASDKVMDLKSKKALSPGSDSDYDISDSETSPSQSDASGQGVYYRTSSPERALPQTREDGTPECYTPSHRRRNVPSTKIPHFGADISAPSPAFSSARTAPLQSTSSSDHLRVLMAPRRFSRNEKHTRSISEGGSSDSIFSEPLHPLDGNLPCIETPVSASAGSTVHPSPPINATGDPETASKIVPVGPVESEYSQHSSYTSSRLLSMSFSETFDTLSEPNSEANRGVSKLQSTGVVCHPSPPRGRTYLRSNSLPALRTRRPSSPLDIPHPKCSSAVECSENLAATASSSHSSISMDVPRSPLLESPPVSEVSDSSAASGSGGTRTPSGIFWAWALVSLAFVIESAARFLRRPLAFFFYIWFLRFTISRIFGPFICPIIGDICLIPGMSQTNLCANTCSALPVSTGAVRADFPRLVEVQTSTIEQLVEEAEGGADLALYITKAEMAASDLLAVVKISDMGGQEVVANLLSEFVDNAAEAVRALQRLEAKTLGTVERLIFINGWALDLIEAAPAESAGFLTSLLWRPSHSASEVVIETFLESMNGQSANIEDVINQAETSLRLLEMLKDIVRAIHFSVTTVDKTLKVKQHELLSNLWSKLGGNLRDKRVFNNNFELLHHLFAYHDMVKTHVQAALFALRTIEDGIKEIQTSVHQPGIENSTIPVEVHVRSLRIGSERLKAARTAVKRRRRQKGFKDVVNALSIEG